MKKKNKKILIVEDNIVIANNLKNYLENIGYEISGIVTFGEDAIKLADNNSADLILMDINLAGDVTGLKAAELINTKYDIPFIFLTANVDKETLEQASRSNLYGYLLKPYEEKELKITIEMAFYKHRIYLDQKKFYKNIEDLHETATRFQNCITFDQIIKISAEMAHQFCKFEKYAVYKINYNELDYIIGTYKPSLENYEFNYIKKIAELTSDEGSPFIFGDLNKSPIEAVKKIHFNSCISAPMGDIGVFQFFSTEGNAFNHDQLRLVKLLLEHTYEAVKRIYLEQELREQAIRDPLTNAYNRFYLYKLIEREKILAKKEHRKLVLMMVDINNLKKINDNYGHLIGDKVIQIVSSIISKEKNNKDTLIRYGGDEFLFILPEQEIDSKEIEKKILERTQNWNKNISEFDFNISFAIGSVLWDSKENIDLEDILTKVDEQMYLNKVMQRELF